MNLNRNGAQNKSYGNIDLRNYSSLEFGFKKISRVGEGYNAVELRQFLFA